MKDGSYVEYKCGCCGGVTVINKMHYVGAMYGTKCMVCGNDHIHPHNCRKTLDELNERRDTMYEKKTKIDNLYKQGQYSDMAIKADGALKTFRLLIN